MLKRQRLDQLLLPHLDGLVELRRDFHRHPELSHQEFRTSDKVSEHLTGLGLQPRRAATTGVIVDIGHGPAVALRADMDALPIEEQGDREYRSTHPGVMHACGHDGHTTILLGVASALASVAERLDESGRRVRLLFQPAEEGGGGAERMIEEGALDGVEAVFGLHNWPVMPFGVVGIRPGPLMAASGLFKIEVSGRGGHASQPQNADDAVLAAAQIVCHLQALVARETDPREPVVVSVCTIHGGSAPNVLPDNVDITGTIRALQDEQIDRLGARLEAKASAVASASGCRAACVVRHQYPALVNHEAETQLVTEVVEEVLGPGTTTSAGLPALGAEDFSYYLKERPGAFLFLGAKKGDGDIVPIHSSAYDFNDDLILPAGRIFLGIVERYLGIPLC